MNEDQTLKSESSGIASLALKLSKVQMEMNRVPKNGINAHFKYPYATEGDIKDTVRPMLAEHGVAFTSRMIDCQTENKRSTVTLEFTFICADTGAMLSYQWVNHADDGQDKGIAKACTLGLKYFLINFFLISTGDEELDPDRGIQNKSTSTNGAGQGKKKQPAPEPHAWATTERLDTLLAATRQTYPSLSVKEFAAAAGISNYYKLDEWNQKYETGGAAGKAALAALDQPDPDPDPDPPDQPPLIDPPATDTTYTEPNGAGRKSAFSRQNQTPPPVSKEAGRGSPDDAWRNEYVTLTEVVYTSTGGNKWGHAYADEDTHKTVELYRPEDLAILERYSGGEAGTWQLNSGTATADDPEARCKLEMPVEVILRADNPRRIDIEATRQHHMNTVPF